MPAPVLRLVPKAADKGGPAGGSGYRRPESVLVIVYSACGKALVMNRRKPFPFWQSVTGSLKEGETPAQAAMRELGEETGLRPEQGALEETRISRVFVIDPRWRHRYAPGVVENVEYEWRFRIDAPREIALSAREHTEFAWLPAGEAAERVWSWTNQEALQDLAAEFG